MHDYIYSLLLHHYCDYNVDYDCLLLCLYTVTTVSDSPNRLKIGLVTVNVHGMYCSLFSCLIFVCVCACMFIVFFALFLYVQRLVLLIALELVLWFPVFSRIFAYIYIYIRLHHHCYKLCKALCGALCRAPRTLGIEHCIRCSLLLLLLLLLLFILSFMFDVNLLFGDGTLSRQFCRCIVRLWVACILLHPN